MQKVKKLVRKIKVLDQYGRFASRLVKRTKNAGAYEINWDGKNYKGRSVKQGYYYAVLWSNGKLKTIKMYKN